MRYFTSSLPPRVAQGCYSEFGAGSGCKSGKGYVCIPYYDNITSGMRAKALWASHIVLLNPDF